MSLIDSRILKEENIKKIIKGNYFKGTFSFVYSWRRSLIAVVGKCRVHRIRK
jgi:hypothetical protein